MKRILSILLLVCMAITIKAQNMEAESFVNEKMSIIGALYKNMLASLDTTNLPPRTIKNGKVHCVNTSDWTSGFFGGSLWYLYEYTQNPLWLEGAKKFTHVLEKEKNNTSTHDLGFMLYCSYGNGYRLTGTPAYKEIMLQGAQSLCTRFRPKVGCIKSWESWGGMTFPVIIDNMMNLEFLFWATRASGDSGFYKIAITHADTTLRNHFRPDYSTWHVVDYDSTSGRVIRKRTVQGANDESAWARGQAWCLYGYTLMYRETKNPKYLNQAINVAQYFIKRLPADCIPYWDFDVAQNESQPRDASAAAIAASALFELSGYAGKARQTEFFRVAEKMIKSLSSAQYMAKPGENGNFIIKHCTGHKPANSEIDVPLVYADYYYIEALMRYCGKL